MGTLVALVAVEDIPGTACRGVDTVTAPASYSAPDSLSWQRLAETADILPHYDPLDSLPS